MSTSAPPAEKTLWSLPEVIAWRRRLPWLPPCSNRQALAELRTLLNAGDGDVEVIAAVEGVNPLWPDARKAAFERNNHRGVVVILSKPILAEVDFELEHDNDVPVGGTITWKKSRFPAFSDPRFEPDRLAKGWLALLDERQAASAGPASAPPTEPVPGAALDADERLYLQRIDDFAITDDRGTWLPLRTLKLPPYCEGDLEWAKKTKIKSSRTKIPLWRKKHGMARPAGRPKKGSE
jgi:hypothetical protein